ncbi:MAG: 4Fe-4S binding protein [Treponema sp.]|jgi:2-oxoglutarate ferredoxin oxidoreductase subunit delta|nr:4Fe-4S binding protein [Treponema sp.]
MAKRGKIEIDRELCKGCLLCVRACPTKVLEADTEFNSSGSYPAKQVNPDKCEPAPNLTAVSGQVSNQRFAVPLCIACGNCYEVCPDICIRVFELGEQE